MIDLLKPLIVTPEDVTIFKSLILKSNTVDPIEKNSHQKLFEELKSAMVLPSSQLPSNVVRLNSVVSIKTSFGIKKDIQLVLPSNADLSKNRLSVMSPMGAALIGYQEGDSVLWSLPRGEEEITILKVNNN
ncbi:MAG: GreA/GreB family elongation factor [Salibacteraceae bacterium]